MRGRDAQGRKTLTVMPPVPLVPIPDFSKLRMHRDQWADVWSVCGPSIERNLNKLPLWLVFCAVYLEGLHHGSEITHQPYVPEPLTQLGDPEI